MRNLEKIKEFDEQKGTPTVIYFGADNYHYARKISNSRFGHMPAGIAYCETAEHVQKCLTFCKNNNVDFRIRSGGHQHEGMSSATDVLIIDLSKIYGTTIEYSGNNTAWIPAGMKLEVVYNQLQKDKNAVIPGGGCQSVNVGGLTQGGGWGTHIRKFGLTCDSLLEVEMVKADGTVINTELDVKSNKLTEKERTDILWALRGGGGGNFGVVTKFKFRLSDLGPVRSTFTIQWTSSETTVKKAIACWVAMHLDGTLTNNLSASASLSVVKGNQDEDDCKSKVIARVSGRYYGEQEDLLEILKTRFKGILPLIGGKPKMQSDYPKAEDAFASWTRTPKKKVANRSSMLGAASEHADLPMALENQYLTDFITGHDTFETPNPLKAPNLTSTICDRPYSVLPNAPAVTCDAPHPHKVTSTYPRKEADHNKIINTVYQELSKTLYFPDVRQYMVWHCLGGKMTEIELVKNSCFAYRDKPYLLQLQCWWNNSGKLTNDEGRSTDYVNWVNDFRKVLHKDKLVEGSFINFVDKDLVPELKTEKDKYDLLKYYYGDNLDKLIKIKNQLDSKNLFNFAMSIPTEKPSLE